MKSFLKIGWMVLCVTTVFFFSQNLSAQTYYFVQVQGKISSGGSALAKGSKVSANSKIKIAPGAKAVVMSSTSGRFVLPKPGSSKTSEFEDILTNVISPLKTNGQASTRGVETIEDLPAYFTDGGLFAILGDTLTFHIEESSPHQLGPNKALFFVYKYGGKSVTKKLPNDGNWVTIDKSEIFSTASGDPVPVEEIEEVYVFFSKDVANKSNQRLTSFTPIFINLDELKADLDFLTEMEEYQSETDDTGRYYHLYRFVRDVYGVVSSPSNLKYWLSQNGYITDNNVKFDEERDKANTVDE